MSVLTLTEQKHVRTALHNLRYRLGTWAMVAKALGFASDTLKKVMQERDPITANMAFQTARFLNASIDDLLAGSFLQGACPRCGYVADFTDEATTVETTARLALGDGHKPT
jgi:hypothetical protein